MNLTNLSSALPKPWLNVACNSLTTNTLNATIANISNTEAKTLSLINQTSVTAPASGEIVLYSTATGGLTTMDPQGTVTNYGNALASNVNYNTLLPIAAPGQNYLWQATASATVPKGGTIIYNSYLNILISGGLSTGLTYSVDYGVNWINCTFDVASAEALLVGFNSTVMVALGTGTESYTSIDGINWTKRAALPSAAHSFNIEWFPPASLFIAGSSLAGSLIMTSPNGQVWTLRTSTIEALSIKTNGTIIVAVGQNTPFVQYSTNGLTWTNTASTLNQSRAVAYSPAKNQFFCLSYITTEGWISTNGITWTSVGAVGPTVNVNDTLFWVSSRNYNRWYLSKADANANYGLWTTPDATIPFSSANLDGAINLAQSYSAGYIPSQDRFFIGVNNAPYFAYSTARNDLKLLTDNLRSRGFPVVTSMYSTIADIPVNSTTTETTVSTGGIGSLVLPDSQGLGCVVELKMFMAVTSAAGDTLTARIKINGATVSTNTITVGAVAGVQIELNSVLAVQAATLRYNNKHIIANTITQSTGSIAFTRTVTNTLSVTLQWTAALSSCSVNSLLIKTSFLNGA